MRIAHLDHLVLTVRCIETTCKFYSQVLGMSVIQFGEHRIALQFGQQKINLHQWGNELLPHAHQPVPGSADLCFITETPLEAVVEHLSRCGVSPETGIVPRTGARGAIASIYLRDPDGNLLELSNYRPSQLPSISP